MISHIISTPHKELNEHEKKLKLYYIMELCRLDEEFDAQVCGCIGWCIEKGVEPAKIVSSDDLTPQEQADILQPIEK